MNLEISSVLNLDLSSSQPRAPGSSEHSVLLGKVAFFTQNSRVLQTIRKSFGGPMFFTGIRSDAMHANSGNSMSSSRKVPRGTPRPAIFVLRILFWMNAIHRTPPSLLLTFLSRVNRIGQRLAKTVRLPKLPALWRCL